MPAHDLIFCGDLVLDEPDPEFWLSGIAPRLQGAQLSIGHLEVPHTRRGRELAADVPAPGAPPEHLAALQKVGLDAVTLAGNHIADCGAEGIADTIAELDRLGIGHCGAGADLARAREPAWLQAGAAQIALLSYNCVGPQEGWAQPASAGCAYVRVLSADGGPIRPAAPLHTADPLSVAQMAADIRGVRKRGADCCIVALHKGIVHTPVTLAPYERPLAHAAIDAGADLVIAHHAHILRGIEQYRDRPIFHGLGNGCVVTRALSPDQANPQRAEWARRRRVQFGFEPDPDYFLAPFHPEAIHGMLARVIIAGGRLVQAGFIPVHVEAPGRPTLATGARAEAIVQYVRRISLAAGLPTLPYAIGTDMVRIM
ncbi:MAG TPA: CapA family protein [Steroidobacteraceae bacterium]|jgi:poly-gamma-glutamate synthesis protein (capsule biosynthesis protein)|nr:CapA family protein [Steroidobacteraceae bacterium]